MIYKYIYNKVKKIKYVYYSLLSFFFNIKLCRAQGPWNPWNNKVNLNNSGLEKPPKNPSPETFSKFIIDNVFAGILWLIAFLCMYIIVKNSMTLIQGSGSEEKVKKARDSIFYALLGLVVTIISYSVVTGTISRIIDIFNS